jgi:hypothetical protein
MMRRTLSAAVGLLCLMLVPRFAAAQTEKPVDVTGEWEMTAETPVGKFTNTLKLVKMGEQLTGRSVSMDGREGLLNNVKLVGKTLTFDRDISVNGMDLHLVYTGAVNGDKIEGTFETAGQTMNWSAVRKAATPAPTAVGVAGTWKLSVDTPNGTRERTLVLKQEGDKLTGTLTGPMDQATPLQEVSFKGKELRFSVSFDRDGQTIKRSYVATIDGDMLKGSVEGGTQSRSFTGKRETAPVAAGIAGSWKLSVKAPDQTYMSTLVLTEQAGAYTGKLQPEGGSEGTLKEVSVKGSQLAFTVDLTINGQAIHLSFTGSIDGDKLQGSFNNGDAIYPVAGERQPKV